MGIGTGAAVALHVPHRDQEREQRAASPGPPPAHEPVAPSPGHVLGPGVIAGKPSLEKRELGG